MPFPSNVVFVRVIACLVLLYVASSSSDGFALSNGGLVVADVKTLLLEGARIFEALAGNGGILHAPPISLLAS
jgi:hypothetical protein